MNILIKGLEDVDKNSYVADILIAELLQYLFNSANKRGLNTLLHGNDLLLGENEEEKL